MMRTIMVRETAMIDDFSLVFKTLLLFLLICFFSDTHSLTHFTVFAFILSYLECLSSIVTSVCVCLIRLQLFFPLLQNRK
jgi:hypothetical protein